MRPANEQSRREERDSDESPEHVSVFRHSSNVDRDDRAEQCE